MPKNTNDEEESVIKQGTIAEFMRKRTQLVGFEFGYWKHTQYVAEFLDNALDAIESFEWEELKRDNSNIKFSLNQELSLENLSIVQKELEIEKKSKPMDEEAKQALLKEFHDEPISSENVKNQKEQLEKTKSGKENQKAEFEVEEEVRKIIDDMEEITKPVENLIDIEPIVIIRLKESEAASFLTSELSQKNVMSYTFEIFDNGTGMAKSDLKKFGRYLASSKSVLLRQTRGSQGFGAPSAFSDSQNTTGKPIVAVSKSADTVYATVSEFFTTSENEKKYLIAPTEVDSPFLHGTYIKLHFLNVKYVRGFAETYVKETSLMNPHITIIYIDPFNEEHIFPRKVSSFPLEPKYALPHPSSINIGDLQDLLGKSTNITVSSFLKENFVRMSSKIAKDVIVMAERDLQDKKKLLILNNGYIEIPEKQGDQAYFLRYEKRIFGRSQKPRELLIVYEINSDELKNEYWLLVSKYNQLSKEHAKLNKHIIKFKEQAEKLETEKERKVVKKDINTKLAEIDSIIEQKNEIKTELDQLFKNHEKSLTEIKKVDNYSDFENMVKEVEISKAKPSELTSDQFNSLFLAFKSIKYMAPPTDTAIPVGETILENTLIKELGLRVSENLDYFEPPLEDVNNSYGSSLKDKENLDMIKDENGDQKKSQSLALNLDEIINFNSQILNSININNSVLNQNQFSQLMDNFLEINKDDSIESYQQIFEYFLENYTKNDDFISSETREPTSGKGLAYVVEAVMAYSDLIEVPKRSRDVLSRFVNRTPKLRDSSDCAITKAVQSVNWKNYKLDLYDNNLPKGPIKLLINVSGPFVHLMFKSQSKTALADDENLIKEIKSCLEAIGRRLRIYLNRKASQHKTEKRASVIEKFIPKFVKSVYNIATRGDGRFKGKIDEEELQRLMKEAIGKKLPSTITQEQIEIKPEARIVDKIHKEEQVKEKEEEGKIITEIKPIPKSELISEKEELLKKGYNINTIDQWSIKELRQFCQENDIKLPAKINKLDIIKLIQEKYKKVRVSTVEEVKVKIIEQEQLPPIALGSIEETEKPTPSKEIEIKPLAMKIPIKSKVAVSPLKTKQTLLPIITTDSIVDILTDDWQSIKHLILKLKIKDMMDARFLQIKLKELERKGKVLVDVKKGKKHWKLNKG